MASDFIALLIYMLFSLFFPASLILFSKLIRRGGNQNAVARRNFESSEESTGSRLSIMKEYFHYFSAFLAFEVITAIILIWVVIARSLSGVANAAVIAFTISGVVLEAFAMLIALRG